MRTVSAAEIDLLIGHRLELRCDGKLILATTIYKRPENHAEMVRLLKDLIDLIEMMEAPDVSDRYEGIY